MRGVDIARATALAGLPDLAPALALARERQRNIRHAVLALIPDDGIEPAALHSAMAGLGYSEADSRSAATKLWDAGELNFSNDRRLVRPRVAPAQQPIGDALKESASDSRLQSEALKLGIREHEWRCPCDMCSRTSQLCPGSRAGLSGLVEDVKARLAAQPLDGMPALLERLELLEAKATRIADSLYVAERDLDRRVDAGSQRLDKLEENMPKRRDYAVATRRLVLMLYEEGLSKLSSDEAMAVAHPRLERVEKGEGE
jgi:hypothetical protein